MDIQKNLFLLNKYKETIGVLSNNMPFSLPFFNDVRERGLDDYINTLTLSIPSNHKDSSLVVTGNYILYPEDTGFSLYKIMEVKESSDSSQYTKEVYGEISAQDDLIKDVVRPVTFNSANLEEILNHILVGTSWQVGNIADFGLQDYEINDYPTKLQAVIDVIKAFKGELNFEYDILNNSSIIKAQKISVYKRLGEETGKMFSYGIDLVGVERVENRTKLVTALVAVGKSNNEGIPMTFAGYSVDQLGGAPEGYTKPLTSDWVGSIKALEKYSATGEPIFGVFKDDKASSPTELFQNTLKALQEYEKPLMTYSISVALLSRLIGYEAHKVNIGDSIAIQDKSMNPPLYVRARVRRLSRSISNPDNDSVELGDYIAVVPSINQRVIDLQNNIRAKEEQWTAARLEAQVAKEKATEVQDTVSNNKPVWDTVIDKANTSYVKEVEKKVTYKVDIISTNGNVFKNGNIRTTLIARVYQGDKDVTGTLDVNRFRWTRVSTDTEGDTLWNSAHFGGTKEINITTEDVKVRATFTCEILEL